jgi:N-acetylmuramoyl-L-alanine amidase
VMLQRIVMLGTLFAVVISSAYAADINDVRLWRAPEYTRVVFDLSAAVKHNVIILENPNRVVIDIEQSKIKTDFGKLDFTNSPIIRVRSGIKKKNDLRIVFDTSDFVKPRSFLLKSSEKSGNRLVVDLYDKEVRSKPAKHEKENSNDKRDIVIAIDPGHGGEDPGASGPNRLREKKVVLAIAKELNYLFSKHQGYRPVLIRTGDYYVGLQKRRKLAHNAQADLLVSIHADAFKDKNVYGSSVYVLSRKGASSTTAKILAAEANNSDLVGGVNLSEKDDVLASVLADLSMSASLDLGIQVGTKVIRAMGGVSKLHSKKVEQANFSVLRSPDIPSILVETGFISNPAEAKRLNTKSFQRKMAKAIFDGVSLHFATYPPPDTYLAWQKRNRLKSLEYTIARGDTLSGIAQRFQVSIASIRQKNDLASNFIQVGQTLIIPAS